MSMGFTHLVAVASVTFLLVGWFFRRSREGLAIRAVADDQAAMSVGVSLPRTLAITWALAGTGDVSSFERAPCACGRTTPRLMGFQGRVGEGVRVRGMFVHPRQIARALGALYAEVPRFQVVVTFEERGTDIDAIVVRVEAEGDPSEVAERLKEALKLRVEVELVTPGTLARDAPRIRDDRTWA